MNIVGPEYFYEASAGAFGLASVWDGTQYYIPASHLESELYNFLELQYLQEIHGPITSTTIQIIITLTGTQTTTWQFSASDTGPTVDWPPGHEAGSYIIDIPCDSLGRMVLAAHAYEYDPYYITHIVPGGGLSLENAFWTNFRKQLEVSADSGGSTGGGEEL